MNSQQAHILLVEDNEGDILLTKEAFEDSKFINRISTVKNGGDALDFLFQRGEFENAEKPDLILLDINLPVKNGHEVLTQIKADENTRKIPIIMLTTSDSSKDINLAYNSHANSYVTKPLNMDDFMDAITKIEEFWIEIVKLSE